MKKHLKKKQDKKPKKGNWYLLTYGSAKGCLINWQGKNKGYGWDADGNWRKIEDNSNWSVKYDFERWENVKESYVRLRIKDEAHKRGLVIGEDFVSASRNDLDGGTMFTYNGGIKRHCMRDFIYLNKELGAVLCKDTWAIPKPTWLKWDVTFDRGTNDFKIGCKTYTLTRVREVLRLFDDKGVKSFRYENFINGITKEDIIYILSHKNQ